MTDKTEGRRSIQESDDSSQEFAEYMRLRAELETNPGQINESKRNIYIVLVI